MNHHSLHITLLLALLRTFAHIAHLNQYIRSISKGKNEELFDILITVIINKFIVMLFLKEKSCKAELNDMM